MPDEIIKEISERVTCQSLIDLDDLHGVPIDPFHLPSKV